MVITVNENSYEESLKASIDKLRETLNELCAEINQPDAGKKRLAVSCQLDELIIEYMGMKK